MGLFDLFKAKPKTPKEMLLFKLRQAFDDCARNAKAQNVGDSLLKSSLIYAALVDLYNTFKSSQEMQALFTIQELNFSESLDAELERALRKHLNRDFYDNLAFKKFEESISVLTKTLKNNIPIVDVIIKHPKKDEYYYAYKKDSQNNPSDNLVIKISKSEDSILITSSVLIPVFEVYPHDANQREIAIDFEEKFWLSMIDSIYFADPILIAPQLRITDKTANMDIIDMLKTRTYFSKSFYDKLSEIESRMKTY